MYIIWIVYWVKTFVTMYILQIISLYIIFYNCSLFV